MLKRLDRYKWQAGDGDEESSSSESSSGEKSAAVLLLSEAAWGWPASLCSIYALSLVTKR
jgi:hypothetical protein